MRISVDTNVLIRAVVQDDVAQSRAAIKALKNAELIAIALPCLCEFVWVLLSVYKFSAVDAANSIHALLNSENVETNRAAVAAGLAILEAGGDFADGVIAFEGNWIGGESFVSFDKKAVQLLSAQGFTVQLLN
jgi:predicted nucleic-acid-binding protein